MSDSYDNSQLSPYICHSMHHHQQLSPCMWVILRIIVASWVFAQDNFVHHHFWLASAWDHSMRHLWSSLRASEIILHIICLCHYAEFIFALSMCIILHIFQDKFYLFSLHALFCKNFKIDTFSSLSMHHSTISQLHCRIISTYIWTSQVSCPN